MLTGAGITGAEVGKAWNEVSGAFEKVGGYSNDEFAEGCDSYFHLSGKFEAMVVDNAIIRIDVTEPGVRTIQGISIGASLADLRQAYGDQLKPEKNPYDGEDIQYVWESKDRGLVFYMRQGKCGLWQAAVKPSAIPKGAIEVLTHSTVTCAGHSVFNPAPAPQTSPPPRTLPPAFRAVP